MSNNLHVIFGTGPLGKWTARELLEQGKQVRLINHSGKTDRLPEGAEIVVGDAFDVARNIEVTKGAYAIYQCAQPLYHEWVEKFSRFQSAIMEAAIANKSKFIVADNLYMYGAIHMDNPSMKTHLISRIRRKAKSARRWQTQSWKRTG